jgi:hypothetical protein
VIGNNDACRYDTSQLATGTQCNTYAGTLALLGTRINGNTLVRAQPGNGNGAGQEEVKICHKGRTIRVGKPAVKAHMKHGDHHMARAPRWTRRKPRPARRRRRAAETGGALAVLVSDLPDAVTIREARDEEDAL